MNESTKSPLGTKFFTEKKLKSPWGRSWNRELFVEKEFEMRETALEPRSHKSVIKSDSTGLTGI
jgi:hypothetical protein